MPATGGERRRPGLLDPGFPLQVAAALQHAQLPADQLMLELGGSAALGGDELVEGVLAKLAERGVKVAIDQLGTGSGHVWRLRWIPATHLKIAAEHVKDMLDTDDSKMAVGVVMEMGRSFGLDVVALGVATAEQTAALTALGWRAGQGRHFATVSREDLADYLASAPTEDPTATAPVIALDSRRR